MCRTRRGRRCLGSRTSRKPTPKSSDPPSTFLSSTSALRPTEVRRLPVRTAFMLRVEKKQNKTQLGSYPSASPPTAEPTPAPPAQSDPPQEEEEEEHTVPDRRRRHLDPGSPLPVAVVIVYKSLGKLLPERYDPDRRSLR